MTEKPAAKPAKELKEPEKSLRFMKDPYQWPLLWLPLKRMHDGQLETACMLDETPTIYRVNLITLQHTVPDPEERHRQLMASKEEFLDHEGIIDAGWKVD